MLKKIVIGGLLAAIVVFAGVFFWAKSVLTGENVRAALAAQVEKAIGQPVTIGAIDAAIMPRVTLTLGDVKVGRPERISVGTLTVGTDFNALLSRRIEHASLRLSGATIELPLPAFTLGSGTAAPTEATASNPPVELVSIDEIVLSDVKVVSGGRTLRGDIEVVPQGTTGLEIRRIALGADGTTFTMTGHLSSFSGPVGELTIASGKLDMDQLLAFVSDFTAGAGLESDAAAASAAPATAPPPAGAPAGMNLAITLETESATMGGLTLDTLAGKARVAEDGLALDPVSFGIFGGRYEGSLHLTPGQTLRFSGRSTLTNVDVAAATAFAGNPDTITGRLSGKLDFAGSGVDPSTVMKTVTGRARVDITNGVVKNLGLVKTVVTATSMRGGALNQVASEARGRSNDEPFTRLGATLNIANGGLQTNDLTFESKDLILNAQGVVQLVASTVDLKGRVQLSDELSKQAGRDLVKYTQDQGRVTLPAMVTGSLDSPSVKIDVGDMAKRALQNAVNEQKERAKTEASKAVQKKLGGLFGR
ncbi:MAG: AsmA family protein [Vicinamibacterales bacterium]